LFQSFRLSIGNAHPSPNFASLVVFIARIES